MSTTPETLIVCEHHIVPQDCPYCELMRLRATITTLREKLAVFRSGNQLLTTVEEQAQTITTLRAALSLFLIDDRFQVAIGGNPHAVEQMMAQAHAALAADRSPQHTGVAADVARAMEKTANRSPRDE